ncbi:MAG: TIGR02452 family protein [Kofleriaceae bacterium]
MSTKLSKFLSFVLRHEPARLGITLDSAGWTDVAALLAAAAAHGVTFTRDELVEVVASSDKQRFAMSPDGTRIRANQGHSVEVELALEPATPPAILYHGTVDRFLASIRAQGLVKGMRHHVHLSADLATAQKVGGRRGKPVVLVVRAADLHAAGHEFFVSQNGVWLTEAVPAAFLDFPAIAPGGARHTSGGGHAAGTASRGQKVKIAEATLAACEAGFYTTAAGARVELAPLIEAAKGGTVMYERGVSGPAPTAEAGVGRAVRGPRTTALEVTGESTLEALVRLAASGHVAGHLACLNFASAKNPGGGFLGGAQAQEESLARSSALYPCQLTQPDHYSRNRANRSLRYLDLALWSPLVPFFRDDDGAWLAAPVLASVITCAAPNAGALDRGSSVDELRGTLERRGRFVLDLARDHGVDTLVLGAWGAGVFRNDPVMVAQIFKALLAGDFANVFARVVFAVIGTRDSSANHRAFAEAFG